MRQLLFVLLLTLVSNIGNARVELQSVYFIGSSAELTEYSSFILDRLKSSFKRGDYQIIEVNAFCESGSDYKSNKRIAAKRLNAVFERLSADSANVTLHNYGSQRIELNFSPVHWNRVDIYYSVVETWKEHRKDTAEIPKQRDTIQELDLTPSGENRFVEISPYYRIPDGVPVTLPLYFKGNKGIMKEESLPALDQLYRTLASYPNITAHFRGHVCCGDKMRLSRKRAKMVYKYLKKRGIAKERISYEGYSNTEPLVWPERTASDRAKNRRVDVIYTK